MFSESSTIGPPYAAREHPSLFNHILIPIPQRKYLILFPTWQHALAARMQVYSMPYSKGVYSRMFTYSVPLPMALLQLYAIQHHYTEKEIVASTLGFPALRVHFKTHLMTAILGRQFCSNR
uniref:Uncharacterized protein n=1 Tax=Schistocephalus solidus TaxID=70667 RepID=A0A0X3PPA9_SCHSO